MERRRQKAAQMGNAIQDLQRIYSARGGKNVVRSGSIKIVPTDEPLIRVTIRMHHHPSYDRSCPPNARFFRGNEMGRPLFSPISREGISLLICHGEMERIRGFEALSVASGSLKMNGSFFFFFWRESWNGRVFHKRDLFIPWLENFQSRRCFVRSVLDVPFDIRFNFIRAMRFSHSRLFELFYSLHIYYVSNNYNFSFNFLYFKRNIYFERN